MATIGATITIIGVGGRLSPALGLPRLSVGTVKKLRCRCSNKASSALAPVVAKGVPLLAKVSARTTTLLASALALADEQMSTEGTWLINHLLGWFLMVAFGLVFTFYILYYSTLDDDDQSGPGSITL